MNPEAIAVFIPIILFLVTGLVLITFFYYRSRERQVMIDKGMDAETIKEMFERKKDNFLLYKIGIISIFFGLGIGIGLMLEDMTDKEYWVPLTIFTITGIGFVISNLTANKLKEKAGK